MMNVLLKNCLALSCISLLGACQQTHNTEQQYYAEKDKAAEIWPKIVSDVKKDPAIEEKVNALLSKMTLEQKVAQMIQPEIRDISVEDMRRYGFGSYLNGGGSFPNNEKHSTAQDWITLAEQMYQASVDDSLDGTSIPTMWGTDAVHGHNNVIGATLFPHNIGLGAANNPTLIEKIAKITATEVMVTGIDWVFAPTVATVRDDRWGRTYEGYSEDPDIVKKYANAIVKGLQGHADKDFLGDDRVISTVKHFIGDGGTVGGDDQGDNIATEQELFDIHGQGYVGGLTAGAQSVMASFNSWHGKKLHGHKYLLTNVLKEQMGFDGFVVGDWNGHGQIEGCTNDNCPQAVNAGLDIYMVPTDAWKPLMENTIKQVNQGVIAQSRIDDAVRRILRVKFRAGLFNKPSPKNRLFSGKTALIGQPSHRLVAQQAVRESLVLLKNKGNILPLNPNQHILVAGDGADNIGKQSGGWTITWQGTNNTNEDFPGGSSIYQGIKSQVTKAGGSVELHVQGEFNQKPDVAVVVFGEEPYAEGHGDRSNLDYQRGIKSDLALLKKLKAQNIPVVSLFISGRPMWVNAELNASDAFVAVWLPGSEGKAVADVLLTDEEGQVQHDFKGKLSFSWPKSADQLVNRFDEDNEPLLPYGFGLSYGDKNILSDQLNEQTAKLSEDQSHVNLFNGQISKLWQFNLIGGDEQKVVNSNTTELPQISYRTIDRNVQEDAFSLTSKAAKHAGISMTTSNGFREDLTAAHEADNYLVMSMRRNNDRLKSAKVQLSCESIGDKPGSCSGSVAIDTVLNRLPLNTWQNIAIPLECFATQGVKFSQIVSPFALFMAGSGTISVSDIEYRARKDTDQMVMCQ
ncbi:glycoside hydrolase family 3 N-terminal domain-containing protein [Thalassotalea sp. 1_MG-2023]|uniref:glycoside hydrolase family 3 protein n=1 Tax=Thalassotalea sp. 1_MG-2023 TaxID=3062680 RepID=UPI0026E327C7|nr:glycoside hydrolase family 3 N-terminal domain-containing protein [Thalassotalea sp. 1_MG-2023]MDO6426374.1 glycoside hydrolase family 3 N-terminal domain-containing protein [Thalassotalea sp. 1_MG-2023]